MNYWQALGKHFGYPKCCIDYFEETMGALGNPLGASVSNNTGFIPCITCAQKIIDGDINIEDLIINRENSEPFPDVNVEQVKQIGLLY